MAVTCFADEIKEEFRNDCELFEAACRDYARQNLKMDDAFFALAFRSGLDQIKARDRFREVSRAIRLLAIAGSPELQAASEKEAATAAGVAEKELPKIDEQISKLQAKRDAIERDARLAAQRVEHQREAHKQLPELTPKVLKKEVGAAENLLNQQGIGAQLRAATARHSELTGILNHGGVYDRPEKHIDGLRRLLPDAVRSIVEGPEGGNRSMRYAYSEQWPSLKAECEREFAEVNQRLPELQREYDAALAIVRKPLVDFWYNLED